MLNIKLQKCGFTILVLLPIVFLLLSCGEQQRNTWLPAWLETSSLNTPRAGAAVVSYNDYIYVLGGVDGKDFLSSIERGKVNGDGAISEWIVVGKMPQARGFFDALIIDNYLYVFGGGNGPNGKNLLRSVNRAKLNSDGAIGEWISEADFLIPRRCAKVFQYENRIYALGGFGGALLDSVEFADVQNDGSLSPWKMAEQQMTVPRYVNAIKKLANEIVVIGGHHQENGSGLSEVESAFLGEKQLNWLRKRSSLKQGRYGLSSAAFGDYIFAMGGLNGPQFLSSVEKFNLDVGQWEQTTALPKAMANFVTIKHKDFIYVIGGTSHKDYLSSVNYATVNGDGDIGIYVTEAQAGQYAIQKQGAFFSNDQAQFANHGIVEDVILTPQYTYLLVQQKQNRIWIAGPVVNVKKGDRVGFSQGVTMARFYSKSLQRNFDEIRFVSQLAFIE